MRSVEEMKRLQNAQAYQKIYQENAQNVDAPYQQYLRAQLPYAEQKRNSKDEYGERARVDAVDKCGHPHERQEPSPPIGKLPKRFCANTSGFEEHHQTKKQQQSTNKHCKFFVHGVTVLHLRLSEIPCFLPRYSPE